MRVLPLLFLACLVLFPSPGMALTILTEESPPSTIVTGEGLSGLGVDIVREIQKRTGDATPITVMPWARAYFMATTTPDVVLFSTTRTSERERQFHWIGPILTITWNLYALKGKGHPLSSLDEARGGIIGTYKDDAREQYLKRLGFTNLDSTTNQRLNMRKLKAGRIDYLVSTNVGIDSVLQEKELAPGELVNVLTIRKVDLFLAFSLESDPAVLGAWDKAFGDMQRDGTLKAIQAKWLPGEAPAN